jgi:hypothetical protein
MTDAFVDDSPVSARVGALSAEACVELFAAYGTEITLAATTAVRDELTLSAAIGFVARGLRATCLIAANEGLLNTSCPCSCQARDWMGEMANQLLGRVKMKLLGLGVDVTLTTPLAFSGVQLTPSPRANVRPSLFTCDSGFVMLWMEVEASQSFEFGAPCAQVAKTGDVILF